MLDVRYELNTFKVGSWWHDVRMPLDAARWATLAAELHREGWTTQRVIQTFGKDIPFFRDLAFHMLEEDVMPGNDTPPTPAPAPAPTPAPVPIDPKNPMTWPRWLKIVASPFIILILIFYFRDQRLGNGIFSKNDAPPIVAPVDLDIGDGVKAHVENNQVAITYANKTVLPADGLVAAYLTKDDDARNPQFLAPYRALLPDESFPVVVFLNATNFDTTSEPVCIRRASDGKILFQAGTFTPVKLMLPKKDGTYHLVLADGTQKTLSEKDWVEKFMRLQYLDTPKPNTKPEDKPQFPAPRPPDGKEKP